MALFPPHVKHMKPFLPYPVRRAAHCEEQWTRQISDKTPAGHQTQPDQLLVEPDVAYCGCIDKYIIQFANLLNRNMKT